jgi:polysaccharide export outer membrane protein
VYRRFLLAALAVCSLAACVRDEPPLVPGEHLVVTSDRDLPAPSGSDIVRASREYRIAPFDQLKINVFGVEELNQTIRADAGGNIALPLAGTVKGAGLTLDELAGQLRTRLTRYIRAPQVSVNLEETSSQSVTVYGQVQQPGQFPVLGKMTLLRAIALAKGANDVANTREVVVFRTINGNNMAALYNLEAIRQGTYPDPDIYGNDVIAVADSASRRLFRDVLQASPLLVTPIVVLLQRL